MVFVNLYGSDNVAPSLDSTGDPYNTNFAFQLHEATLQSARVRLTPFIPSLHAQPFFDAASSAHQDIFQYIPFTFPDLSTFLLFVEDFIHSDPSAVLFTIFVKTGSNQAQEASSQDIAGIIGIIGASARDLRAEIGPVIVLPNFQRTFVSSNAIGLVLRYCLDLPTAANPGLGFRRVQWTANPYNAASIRAAERMGMKLEGTMRWVWVLDEGKDGNEASGRGEGKGRDSVILAVCWDDWEGGVRELVDRLIDRV